MAGIVGEAFVRIRPTTAGFQQEANAEVASAGTKLGRVFGAAFAVAGVGYGVKAFVTAASQQQAAFAVLGRVAENAGASTTLFGQSLDSILEREARLKGFSVEDLASSFQRLVSVTHDTASAYDLLGKSEDLARFRHIGLAQAALGLSKLEQGSATALQRYGLIVPKVTTAVDALKAKYVQLQEGGAKLDATQKAQYESALQVAAAQDKTATAAAGLDLIQQRTGGTSAEYAKTAAGSWDRTVQALKQAEAQVGQGLLPALTVGGQFVANYAHQLISVAEALAVYKAASLLGGSATARNTAATVAQTGALSAYTATLVANTAALAANETVAAEGTIIYGPAGQRLSTVAAAETQVADGAVVAAGAASGLKTSLAGLAALGPIAVVVALSLIPGNKYGQELLDQSHGGFLGKLPIVGGLEQQVAAGVGNLLGDKTQSQTDAAQQAQFQKQINETDRRIAGSGTLVQKATRLMKALEHSGVSAQAAQDQTALAIGKTAAATAAKNLADAAANAATDATAGKKGQLNAAGKALIHSLEEGVATDQQDLTQLKSDMALAVQQGVEAVDQAVQSAKQNLNTIGQSLGSTIAQVLDQPIVAAQTRLTAAQNKLGLTSAKIALSQLRKEVLLPGNKRLSEDPTKALAQLEAMQKSVHGSPGLQNYILQYQQTALGVRSAQIAIDQQRADLSAKGAQRRIADLTDEYNKRQISARQLNVGITKELVRNGVSYSRAGKELGTYFADGFRAQVAGIAQQIVAELGGPQRSGAGLIPNIVRPLETLQQTQKTIAGIASQERAKQLDESRKQTQLLTKINNSRAAAKFTESLTRNKGTANKWSLVLTGTGG